MLSSASFSTSIVFSVTWSFRHHYNMLICSRNMYYYYQCWNIQHHIFVETYDKLFSGFFDLIMPLAMLHGRGWLQMNYCSWNWTDQKYFNPWTISDALNSNLSWNVYTLSSQITSSIREIYEISCPEPDFCALFPTTHNPGVCVCVCVSRWWSGSRGQQSCFSSQI